MANYSRKVFYAHDTNEVNYFNYALYKAFNEL